MTIKNGWRRFARIWQSDTVARVDDEVQFHFELKIAEFEALGAHIQEPQLTRSNI